MTDTRIAYVMQLEERLARLSDWATLADENDAMREELDRLGLVRGVLAGDMPVHEQLRRHRAGHGWSQRVLAAATGLRQQTVCRVESGAPDVWLSSVQAMAEAMGCQVLIIPREVS